MNLRMANYTENVSMTKVYLTNIQHCPSTISILYIQDDTDPPVIALHMAAGGNTFCTIQGGYFQHH